MIIHKDSHTDHAITPDQWAHILEQFKDRSSFFIETIVLPEGLGHVLNGLYGPSCGDGGITEDSVYYAPRPPRTWNSRMTKMPARPTQFVRVIAGPHDGHDCVLFTAYGVSSKGMPAAPQEPGDINARLNAIDPETCSSADLKTYNTLRASLSPAKDFWAAHALTMEAF